MQCEKRGDRFLQGVISDALRYSYYVLSVTKLSYLMLTYMYDVITIPITVKLTQDLDSLCDQRPIY